MNATYDPSARRDEGGAVGIFGLLAVVLAVLVMLGVSRAGGAAVAAARADRAADAAALAAAHALARVEGSAVARAAARETAAQNDARLVRCDCAGDAAEVVVVSDGATGRARAEVRVRCILDPEGCDDR